ncbi:MAG: hypothetical protein JO354_12460 [Verrucomicrobia bacterium]|nr:hypothetical protein [Verrucomicrobiota bacterium]
MQSCSVRASHFDLVKTLDSGQVFHWEKYADGFVGTIEQVPVYVEQRGSTLKVSCNGAEQSPGRVIRQYFALDHPLKKICASFPPDAAMNQARDFCRGLRIIRQPKWECLATFICSSMKQVAHIRQISRALRQRYGRKLIICGITTYDFPGAGRLARASEEELRVCGLGYRAKNLLATSRRVATGEAHLEAWNALPDDELRARLCELPGVGAKVANCVMLFAYERIAAFPIDVWIERVLRQNYFARKRKVTPRKLAEFAAGYFGEYGGYAQQYLFHYARLMKRRADPY